MNSQELKGNCPLCGDSMFERLPSPWECSMTTAGKYVQEPLAKAQCSKCGILQRVEIRHLAETEFYETSYSFYERPGASEFDAPRYAAMAEWIAEAISPVVPENAFDAGCGRGWMIDALSELFPNTSFEGVEPSEQESENARQRGLAVTTGKVDPSVVGEKRYDFVYSTNVVEHTVDPIGFLRALGGMLSDRGVVVVLCPDSSDPSAEFMFSDQNFSFTPEQLAKLGERAGLTAVSWSTRPQVASLFDKQLMVFTKKNSSSRPSIDFPSNRTQSELFQNRSYYVLSYQRCNDFLLKELEGARRVINFGTSTWSMLLAAYCPDYWNMVDYCAIDGGAGEFLNKQVLDAGTLTFEDGDVVVLGTNPITQGSFVKRFGDKGVRCVSWSHIVAR